MRISKRLQAVASMIQIGKCVADVGTDHGYIPIYLVKENRCERGIAMDIGEGPLQRAKDHIKQYGLDGVIETRLSDGVQQMKPGEADCMVVAGMGGSLVVHILEDGCAVIAEMKECVLQPQSEIHKVRQYLWEHEYAIVEENMIVEDGKYYPMLRVIPGQHQNIPEELFKMYAQFGQLLLENGNQVLKQYLDKEYRKQKALLTRLEDCTPKSGEKFGDLRKMVALLEQALKAGKW